MLVLLKWIDQANKVVKLLLGIFIAIMSVIIIFQIFSRFFLDLPLPWSEELARYLSIYSVFLGAAIALRYQQLISVEIVVELISEHKRKILKIAVLIICVIFFVLLFIKGLDMLQQVNTQLSPAMQIPMSIPYAAVPIGALMLILNSIAVMIETLRGEAAE